MAASAGLLRLISLHLHAEGDEGDGMNWLWSGFAFFLFWWIKDSLEFCVHAPFFFIFGPLNNLSLARYIWLKGKNSITNMCPDVWKYHAKNFCNYFYMNARKCAYFLCNRNHFRDSFSLAIRVNSARYHLEHLHIFIKWVFIVNLEVNIFLIVCFRLYIVWLFKGIHGALWNNFFIHDCMTQA